MLEDIDPSKIEDYSSYNVAKKVLELDFKVEIPRRKFQPNYGSGFKGAPLQP